MDALRIFGAGDGNRIPRAAFLQQNLKPKLPARFAIAVGNGGVRFGCIRKRYGGHPMDALRIFGAGDGNRTRNLSLGS